MLRVAFVASAVAGTVAPPADWVDEIAASNMLYSANPLTNMQFNPPLENGFIGGDVGCSGGSGGSAGRIQIGGVYSGANSRAVARAAIPNPLAAEPADTGAVFAGAALLVSEGSFLQRWDVSKSSCGAVAILQSRRYVHRLHRSLLILEYELLNATSDCQISLNACIGGPSGMSVVQKEVNSTSVWEESSPEQPADPTFPHRNPATVAVSSDTVPSALDFKGATKSLRYLCVVHTTLEQDIDTAEAALAKTKQDLAIYRGTADETLAVQHSAAWSEVLSGGVEVGGNQSLAAMVNSSFYYLFASVRSDW